ncbi:hypothetical protein Tco_0199492 [Tanacetum coccineum]
MIRHLKRSSANVNDRSREHFNAIEVTALIEQMIADRVFKNSDGNVIKAQDFVGKVWFLRSKEEIEFVHYFLATYRLSSTKQSDSSAQITERNSSTMLCLISMKVLDQFIKSLDPRSLLTNAVVERCSGTLSGIVNLEKKTSLILPPDHLKDGQIARIEAIILHCQCEQEYDHLSDGCQNAFLNGGLKKKSFVSQEGFEDRTSYTSMLRKEEGWGDVWGGLYGLNQGTKAWNEEFDPDETPSEVFKGRREKMRKSELSSSFLPQGRAPVGGVTLRDPLSETTSKLHEVIGKGKAVVMRTRGSFTDQSSKKKRILISLSCLGMIKLLDSTTGLSSH